MKSLPLTDPDSSDPHHCWPAERFYWSVLEAPGYRGRGELPAGLRSAFEEDLPVPGEQVHAVATTLGHGQALVCAATRESLLALDATVLSLSPGSLPACIPGELDPAALNLLAGIFEPASLRRARSRRHLLRAASLVLCASLLSLGLFRRAEHWQQAAHQNSAAAASLLASTGGTVLGLQRELERLERVTGSALAGSAAAPDAAPALAALLRAWPAAVPSKPLSIRIDHQGASIEVGVEGDASPFLAALEPPTGWTLHEPRLNTAGSLTRLSLTLRPETTP